MTTLLESESAHSHASMTSRNPCAHQRNSTRRHVHAGVTDFAKQAPDDGLVQGRVVRVSVGQLLAQHHRLGAHAHELRVGAAVVVANEHLRRSTAPRTGWEAGTPHRDTQGHNHSSDRKHIGQCQTQGMVSHLACRPWPVKPPFSSAIGGNTRGLHPPSRGTSRVESTTQRTRSLWDRESVPTAPLVSGTPVSGIVTGRRRPTVCPQWSNLHGAARPAAAARLAAPTAGTAKQGRGTAKKTSNTASRRERAYGRKLPAGSRRVQWWWGRQSG